MINIKNGFLKVIKLNNVYNFLKCIIYILMKNMDLKLMLKKVEI